jgi:hypothetical protein
MYAHSPDKSRRQLGSAKNQCLLAGEPPAPGSVRSGTLCIGTFHPLTSTTRAEPEAPRCAVKVTD